MSELSLWTLGLGVAHLVLGGIMVVKPDQTRRILRWFPRSVWPGRILSVGLIVWSAWWLSIMPLDGLSFVKKHLLILCLFFIYAIVVYMEDLLSPRALGGLFLMLPSPLFDAARWHTSDLRLIVTVWAYIIAVVGMILVMSPFRFRHWAEFLMAQDFRFKLAGHIGLVLGILFTVLALTVYRTA